MLHIDARHSTNSQEYYIKATRVERTADCYCTESPSTQVWLEVLSRAFTLNMCLHKTMFDVVVSIDVQVYSNLIQVDKIHQTSCILFNLCTCHHTWSGCGQNPRQPISCEPNFKPCPPPLGSVLLVVAYTTSLLNTPPGIWLPVPRPRSCFCLKFVDLRATV